MAYLRTEGCLDRLSPASTLLATSSESVLGIQRVDTNCAIICFHLSLWLAGINRQRQEMGTAQIENNGAVCTKGVRG